VILSPAVPLERAPTQRVWPLTLSISRLHVCLLLLAFLALGLILRVGVAVRSPNVEWADEIYQVQEPAHRLAYGYGVITWEWRRGVRSWVFPAFLAGVMRATDWMGPGSRGYLWGIAFVLSLISLTTVWFGYAWGKRAGGMSAAILAAGACAIWFELVFFGSKSFTEVLAAHVLLPGLYLGAYPIRGNEKKSLFLAGLFCGLALSLRIQLAPATLFAVLYACYPHWRKRALPIALGILIPVLAFGLVDAFTWSHPFQSFWLYFSVNYSIVEGRSLLGGTAPWYWYLVRIARRLGPVALLAIVGARRSPFLGWIALIILVSHSMLAHKEIRYIYPLVPIALTLSALGVLEIVREINSRWKSALRPGVAVVAALVFYAFCSGFLASRFPDWSRRGGSLIALERLSTDSAVCGVGVEGVDLWDSASYTYLHQKVPIIIVPRATELQSGTSSFNALLLTDRSLAAPRAGFDLVRCWKEACLYERPGACAPDPYNEINAVAERTGR
jgi:GPI mannosyltransferase 3